MSHKLPWAGAAREASLGAIQQIALFATKLSRQPDIIFPYFSGLRDKFVTWRNNGIFVPINEFRRANNRIAMEIF